MGPSDGRVCQILPPWDIPEFDVVPIVTALEIKTLRGFKKEQIIKLGHIPRDDRQGDRPTSDDLTALRQQCKLMT